jgi:hypothetical protein
MKKTMHAIILHGMGRTPLAMSILSTRLRRAGIRPHLFGYSVTFERWEDCLERLERFVFKHTHPQDYIMIGHSLGSVLTRAVLPSLIHQPQACFFLAPPTQVCRAARKFAHRPLPRLLMGDMGKVLALDEFMNSLPVPGVPTKVYAGTGGPRGRYSPFGTEPNDGVLMVRETMLPGVPLQTVPLIHTFIMNSRVVTRDIVRLTRSYRT